MGSHPEVLGGYEFAGDTLRPSYRLGLLERALGLTRQDPDIRCAQDSCASGATLPTVRRWLAGGLRAQSIVLPENRAGQQGGDRRVSRHNLDLAWLPVSRSGQQPSPGCEHARLFPALHYLERGQCWCSMALLGRGGKSWNGSGPSSRALGGSSPTCPEAGEVHQERKGLGPGAQAPGQVAQTLGVFGPFALRQGLTNDILVSLGFETQMRMCFEICKLVRDVKTSS